MRSRTLFIEGVSALLILFFVYNSIAIFLQLQSLKNLLAFYTIHTTEVAWLVLAVEVLIPGLLLVPRWRVAGLLLGIFFFLFVLYTLIRTPGYPHDFGGILNNLSSTRHIVLESLLAVLAAAAIWFSVKKPKKDVEAVRDPIVFT